MAIHESIDPEGPLARLTEVKKDKEESNFEPLKLVKTNPLETLLFLEEQFIVLSQRWVQIVASFKSDFREENDNTILLSRVFADCPHLMSLIKDPEIIVKIESATPLETYFNIQKSKLEKATESEKTKILDGLRVQLDFLQREIETVYTASLK